MNPMTPSRSSRFIKLSALSLTVLLALTTTAVIDSRTNPFIQEASADSVTPTSETSSEMLLSSTIEENSGILTMVNVLTPQAGKQDEVVRQLDTAMATEMSSQPGFISANIHRSLDSDHVVVYAQWEDQSSVEAVGELIQSGNMPAMATVFSMAQPDFHPYEVVSVHSAQAR